MSDNINKLRGENFHETSSILPTETHEHWKDTIHLVHLETFEIIKKNLQASI